MLTLPFITCISKAQRILLAGAGGGYDLVGAVPLIHEFRAAGKQVHLASLTFSDPLNTPLALPVERHPILFSVTGASATPERYCPEAWLAHWMEEDGHRAPIWLLRKSGVGPLRAAYQYLVDHLQVDAIVLIDGGIDAALRGDETSIGTPIEDLASLAAVSQLDGIETYLACLGMGAELRDGIPHAQFLARVSELIRTGGFLGCQSLTPQMAAGQAYGQAVSHLFAHQQNQRKSHVQEVVLASLNGEFGPRGEDTWLSPLLPMYWFFDLKITAASHLFLSELMHTETAWEVSLLIDGLRKTLPLQPNQSIPL